MRRAYTRQFRVRNIELTIKRWKKKWLSTRLSHCGSRVQAHAALDALSFSIRSFLFSYFYFLWFIFNSFFFFSNLSLNFFYLFLVLVHQAQTPCFFSRLHELSLTRMLWITNSLLRLLLSLSDALEPRGRASPFLFLFIFICFSLRDHSKIVVPLFLVPRA